MKKTLLAVSAFLVCLSCADIAAAQNKNTKVLTDIEEYIKAGKDAPPQQGQLIIDQLTMDSNGVADALLERARAADVNDEALSVYIWAIGLTKDTDAVDGLIKIANTNKSPLVKANLFRALAQIGSQKAGNYLLAQAKIAQDDSNSIDVGKFGILNHLAEMQYAPALPEMQSILKKNYKQYYRQQIFCFGKMGDKAIPFLLDKITDSNSNTKFAAIVLVGQVLLAEEAVKPLAERYWKEKDPITKKLILSSLERITSDLTEMERFFNEVAKKEQDNDAKQFAEETIARLGTYKERISRLKAAKKDDRQLYQKEYDTFYISYGRGNIETLGIYSSIKDEPQLKKLRERILLRNSDECLFDYERVNNIIMFNRLIAKNKL